MSAAGHLIFVLGPTASGKSALGLELAREFGGSILNCDSVQACARLDIGSAKPTAAERALVPHHLFDIVAPGETLTAGGYRAAALDALATATKHGPVFAVGGSGFYVRALEKGMFAAPPANPMTAAAVRARLTAEGPAALHAELALKDPAYAATLNPNDAYRVVRALIMIADTGRSVTDLRASFAPEPLPYAILKLGLDPDRAVLRERIARRSRRMIEDGLIAETRALIDDGFGDWSALGAVGYREARDVIKGAADSKDLADLITLKTTQLAKKQRTWFRGDDSIRWLDAESALERGRTLVAAFLDGARGAS